MQPDARQSLETSAFEAEWRERADERLLEVAHVLLYVLPVEAQIEDRVADELSGAVVGRLAAAVRLHHVDRRALRDVQLAVLRAPPERHHGRMLEEDHRLRNCAL